MKGNQLMKLSEIMFYISKNMVGLKINYVHPHSVLYGENEIYIIMIVLIKKIEK